MDPLARPPHLPTQPPPPPPPPPPQPSPPRDVEDALLREEHGNLRLRWREAWLAKLAGAQDGVVTRGQLLALGLSEEALDTRREQRRLIPVHEGVYAVGRLPLTRRGQWRAAVLAGGDGAVLSHGTAAALWDLCPPQAGDPHVLVPRARCPRRPGIALHRTIELRDQDVAEHQGLPCTAPNRTLVDLAGHARPPQLARALEAADRLELLSLGAIQDVLSRIARPRGVRILRRLLADYGPPPLTRSELERRFLDVCANHGVPAPSVNAVVEGFEVDFHWPAAQLAVETDGWEHHGTRAAARRDRARDRALARAGWLVLRFMWSDVLETPEAVARDVEDALSRALHGEVRLRCTGDGATRAAGAGR